MNDNPPLSNSSLTSDNLQVPEITPERFCLCKCHIQGGNIDKVKTINTCPHCVKEEIPAIVGQVVANEEPEQQSNSRLTGFQLHPENINRNGRPPREWTWSGLIEQYAEKEQQTKRGTLKWRELVIKRLFVEAGNGNMQAIREIMDRMDGKAEQKSILQMGNNAKIIVTQE